VAGVFGCGGVSPDGAMARVPITNGTLTTLNPISFHYCRDCHCSAMMRWTLLKAALVALAIMSHASRLTPPVLPLIVRNPYLSSWLGNARGLPWETWPMFYTGQTVGLIDIYVNSGLRYLIDWAIYNRCCPWLTCCVSFAR
jgi:hypothetical protein